MDHVYQISTNDVVDVADLVNQIVASRGTQMNLNDSIHAPNHQSVVNLPPKNLRHWLNQLRHKPTSEWSGFLLVSASSIPGYNRLDKLNLIHDLFWAFPDFLDLNWIYHNRRAAVIVEYVNQQYFQQAH